MSRIHRLPDDVINKIAAGEVVERPASVVKELVENALDAGAGAIRVDLGEGGAGLVRVVDDGIGMTAEELELALERHATSKLMSEGDLEAIGSLGFRGEALPAICAVSRFTITTCPRGAADGTRVAGEGGGVKQRLSVPADAGTSVEITDLFFNTPARLKFLKSTASELAATLRALTQLTVAHPDVSVRVRSNGRVVLSAPPARDLRARAGALWGWDVADRLLAVDRSEHGITVRGLVSPPDVTRGGRDDIMVVINGRPVRDPALLAAVLQAYRPLLARDRFPMVAVSVGLPFADVDVNVHPTKAWVRFRHPRLVHEMLAAALGEALRRCEVVPHLALPTPAPSADWAPDAESGQQSALFAEPVAAYVKADFGRVLGQVQDTFIVTASAQEVFFLDQHAAHERVIFERLQAELTGGNRPAQALLFPEPLDLAPAALALLERWREPLERLGFGFEGFGGEAIVLRAVPAVLKGDEPRRLIEAAVDELGGPRGGEPLIDRALSFVACRAAIKANTPLERDQMEGLVDELVATATPYFCPHGRPTMSRISLLDVRREVRRVW